MRVFCVDNYDSFTYNLVQALEVLGAEVTVFRNDAISPGALVAGAPDRILISPGPGGPSAAGISSEVIRLAAGSIPLLGVCLGHQCLASVFGARITRVPPIHGKTSPIRHQGRGLFAGLPSPFDAARYHSLAVEPDSLPEVIEITARSTDGVIMAIAHRELALVGVQFHPESFLTPDGPRLLANFLDPAWATRPLADAAGQAAAGPPVAATRPPEPPA